MDQPHQDAGIPQGLVVGLEGAAGDGAAHAGDLAGAGTAVAGGTELAKVLHGAPGCFPDLAHIHGKKRLLGKRIRPAGKGRGLGYLYSIMDGWFSQ